VTIIFFRRCGASVLALSLCACASQSRQTQAAAELSVRATLASQILHPEAVRNANPVSGIDGAAALHAQQKYEKSFGRQGADSDAPLVQRR
jgi:hypothetical protein